jgi:hypothetical protein
MFDPEIEAIAKCTELIKDLEKESKFRVIKYLIERFGIGMEYTNQYQPTDTKTESKLLMNHSDQDDVEIEYTETVQQGNNDYPTLKDLLIKNYPKTETEWILCYSFYSSSFGNDTFTKDDILEKYKDNNRYSKSNAANLSNNLKTCVKKDWIKSVNDDDFIMKDEGKSYAKKVISGNSDGVERKSSKRKNTDQD